MPRVRWLTYVTALLYTSIVLVCALHHESWFDEAQAWLIARDLNIPDLLFQQMRYEGSPALWHLLLMPFAKSGFPYERLSLVSAGLSIAGVYLFLWRSPFPDWLRLLFPFCYFPLYQYAVVARSYSLVMPLLFGLAVCFPGRVLRKPVLYCTLLVLLSNSSVHGALIAAVLAVEWMWTAWRAKLFDTRRGLACGIVTAFTLNYVAIFFELWPIPKVITPGSDHGTSWAMFRRALKQISEAFWGGLGSNAYHTFSAAIALAAVVLSVYWFKRTSAAAVFVAATGSLLMLAFFVQAAAWHAGLIFLIWIFCLWVFFEQAPSEVRGFKPLHILIGAVFTAQIAFGIRSIVFDIGHAYSGTKAAAEYLKTSGDANAKLFAVSFKAFGIQPYFDRNVFSRQEHGRREAFYRWAAVHPFQVHEDLDRQQPDVLVIGIGDSKRYSQLDKLPRIGYCEAKRFEGSLWWKNGESEPDSIVVFKRCRR